MNYLPINLSLLNEHKTDCWSYYCFLRQSIYSEFFNFTDTSITINIKLNSGRCGEIRHYANLGKTTWYEHSRDWNKDCLDIVDENTTLMPFEVFDVLHDLLYNLDGRYRAPLIRLYFYLYFRCHANNNDFGIDVNRLAIELGTSASLVSMRLKWLIENGLLVRVGKYSAIDSRSYRYMIPKKYESDII